MPVLHSVEAGNDDGEAEAARADRRARVGVGGGLRLRDFAALSAGERWANGRAVRARASHLYPVLARRFLEAIA